MARARHQCAHPDVNLVSDLAEALRSCSQHPGDHEDEKKAARAAAAGDDPPVAITKDHQRDVHDITHGVHCRPHNTCQNPLSGSEWEGTESLCDKCLYGKKKRWSYCFANTSAGAAYRLVPSFHTMRPDFAQCCHTSCPAVRESGIWLSGTASHLPKECAFFYATG